MAAIDSNTIIENLTQLLTNSVNMSSVFYDIFLNPEPMDVELAQYDNNGDLKVVSIPNRAKDRRIAIEGPNSPEGTVTATVGTVYVDTSDLAVYFKASGSGNTGWVVASDQVSVDSYIRNYLADNNFTTTSDLGAYLTEHDYTTSSMVSNIISQSKPTIPMEVRTNVLGTVTLADNQGYALTASGNITFQLPTISDLSILHKIFIQLYLPSSSYTINLGTTIYFNKVAPVFTTAGMYDLTYEYDNAREVWVVGSTIKGTP